MSKSGTDEENQDGKVVNVSEKGQATIPKEFREKHGIETPGKVEFHENEEGEIVVEAIPSVREFRGMGKKSEGERPGTEALKESREHDEEREERLMEYGDDE
ncbi:MAG: AbrB/MazE/SpoVT family DNA-binding domain-containing protein [Halobacteria archaeon]|nr:AbrB/MazE/SpoVT family DNA-binding domain-containing protein [Halobacteria archaeon]